MNNVNFGKTMENVRIHRDIKLVTTEARSKYLVSDSNYHTRKYFLWKFISHRKEKKLKYVWINLFVWDF